MRRSSDRCRSATRPADLRKPSRTAKPDFCLRNRRPNRFSAASGARSRLSRRRIASIRCAEARCRDRLAGTLPRPYTARSTGRLYLREHGKPASFADRSKGTSRDGSSSAIARQAAPSFRHKFQITTGIYPQLRAQDASALTTSSRAIMPANRCSLSITGMLLIRCSTMS